MARNDILFLGTVYIFLTCLLTYLPGYTVMITAAAAAAAAGDDEAENDDGDGDASTRLYYSGHARLTASRQAMVND